MSVTDRSARSPDVPADENGESNADASTALSPDDTFHILQTFRRRESIRYLLRADGPVKMRDVAEHVAAREHETTVAALTSTQRQRVYIPLYQSHLPKLDTAGVIEYEKSRGIVRPTARLESFRPYLEAAASTDAEFDRSSREASRDGHRPTVAALGAGVAFLLATAAGALHVPGVVLGGAIVALFVVAMAVF